MSLLNSFFSLALIVSAAMVRGKGLTSNWKLIETGKNNHFVLHDFQFHQSEVKYFFDNDNQDKNFNHFLIIDIFFR